MIGVIVTKYIPNTQYVCEDWSSGFGRSFFTFFDFPRCDLERLGAMVISIFKGGAREATLCPKHNAPNMPSGSQPHGTWTYSTKMDVDRIGKSSRIFSLNHCHVRLPEAIVDRIVSNIQLTHSMVPVICGCILYIIHPLHLQWWGEFI